LTSINQENAEEKTEDDEEGCSPFCTLCKPKRCRTCLLKWKNLKIYQEDSKHCLTCTSAQIDLLLDALPTDLSQIIWEYHGELGVPCEFDSEEDMGE
jgi:hypothetical protein